MKMRINFNMLTLLLAATASVSSQESSNKLELVHVFFRHGARTPELKDVYPNDPFKIDTFLPMGWGQLTNLGKQQAFKLGQILRKRYGEFLGKIYHPEMVYAQSTDFDRTKMSALLVLAGLFPPSAKQTWNKELPWLPIPLAYEKDSQDYFLRRPIHYCPTYIKELEKTFELNETISLLKEHQETFDYLTNHTGKLIANFSNAMGIYQTLTAEFNMGLTLPEWTKNVFPEAVTQLAIEQCVVENSTPLLKKLNGGRSIQMALRNIAAKTSNSLEAENRKIFLYSGHENNVLNVLAALDLYDSHFPNYSSATILELYSIGEKKFAVKIVYVRDLKKEPEELKMKDCDILCPLDKFITLTDAVVPKNYTAECESSIYLD